MTGINEWLFMYALYYIVDRHDDMIPVDLVYSVLYRSHGKCH